MDFEKLMGLNNKIKAHGKPGQIAFLVYELLMEQNIREYRPYS